MKNFEKLKENHEFRRAYARGKSFVTPFFVAYVLKNRTGSLRFGITAGKKIGGAVQRNRAKRIITAAFRSVSEYIPTGYDLVIVARTRIFSVKSTAVAALLKKQLYGAKLWNEPNKNEQIAD